MKTLILILATIATFQANAGQSAVLTTTKTVDVAYPADAFTCVTGNGGFIFTTISLNTASIPNEFGSNFRNSGISVSFSNKGMVSVPCAEAMKVLNDEIAKQGGQLKVEATRSVSRFAYPDKTCQTFLTENIGIKIGTLELSGVATFFVKETPMTTAADWFACRDLVPDPI